MRPFIFCVLALTACHQSSEGNGSGDASWQTDLSVHGDGSTDTLDDGSAGSGDGGVTGDGSAGDGGTGPAPCVGSQVPGDYATIQAAGDALDNVGGTICLAGQTYSESVSFVAHSSITIRGVASATTITGGVRISASGTLVVSGIAFHGGDVSGLDIQATEVTVADSSFESTQPESNGTGVRHNVAALVVHTGFGTATLTRVSATNTGGGDGLLILNDAQSNGSATVTIDRSTFSSVRGTNLFGHGIQYYVFDDGLNQDANLSTAKITITNAWLHDANVGFAIAANSPSPRSHSYDVLLENLTITNTGTGILHDDSMASDPAATFGYYDTIVDDNGVGVDIDGSFGAPVVTSGNNLFFGNTTNFANDAIDGTGDVKADPKLTGASPPGPGTGSAAIGAGDAAHASDHDFSGKPRGTSIDIGAVQH